jgi:streptomycin 6-kinase
MEREGTGPEDTDDAKGAEIAPPARYLGPQRGPDASALVITVPDRVRQSVEGLGPDGRAWLAALPGIVGELREAWSLSVGAVLGGGNFAYVARVRTADGTDAVLKVAFPGRGFAEQVDTLIRAAGRGYVRLYDSDPVRHAMLLEPLGHSLASTETSVERSLDVLAATLCEAWQVPRPAQPIVPAAPIAPPTGADTDRASGLLGLIDKLWPELGEPCSPRLITHARALAERRVAAFDLASCVLCHGDPHADNALAAPSARPGAETGYVFVAPETFLGDPAYDLGVAMRGWPDHVLRADDPIALARGWSARLADKTGLDQQTIWEWGLIERVTTGLYLLSLGHGALGREYLDSAELLAS